MIMKKIINEPKDVLNEMLEGFTYAHSDLIKRLPNSGVIQRKYTSKNNVALVSGGGSGHEPSHAGFVGEGMLAAAVCGEVFTSPTPDQIAEAIKAANQGAGVLLIVKNYSGDIMNFEMAQELSELDGIRVEQVVVNDDISIEDTASTGKRGVAGTVLVHKILGAAAEAGATLEELKSLGETVVSNMASLGVSLSPAIVPETGKPGFQLADDELEYGVGIHGEPGYSREKMKPSNKIAAELVSKLKQHFTWDSGDHFAVFVNGLGATPLMEQYIFMKDVCDLLEKDKLIIDYKKVGSFMTSIEMAGVSLTLLKLEDDKWVSHLNEAVYTPVPF